jgi:hypothetical protein
MSGPQTFCEKLADFLLSFRYGNDMIIYEDQYGRVGKGSPVGLCISNRNVTPQDFDRARAKRLKVVAENTSFAFNVYTVPNHRVNQEDIPRLIHCSGPPLYSRMWR